MLIMIEDCPGTLNVQVAFSRRELLPRLVNIELLFLAIFKAQGAPEGAPCSYLAALACLAKCRKETILRTTRRSVLLANRVEEPLTEA